MNARQTVYVAGIDRSITLGQYVAAIRLAKANLDQEFKYGLTTWWPTTGAEIRRQFLQGVHDRINQGIPAIRRGISD